MRRFFVISGISAAFLACGGQTESTATDAAAAHDATSLSEASQDADAASADVSVPDDASTEDAWDLPDVDAAACLRDASAMNPTRPGACCVTQDDCQPGNKDLISCCLRNVCVYCGPQ